MKGSSPADTSGKWTGALPRCLLPLSTFGRVARSLALAAALIANPLVRAPARADVISVSDMLRGITRTAEACATTELAVWVEAFGRNFCIRYYLSEAGGRGSRPLVMLQGDQLGRVNAQEQSFRARPDAQPADTEALVRRAAHLSRAAKGPAIYMARVGLDGSSGHHVVRRTLLELHATNAALDAIKTRHAFEGFHLVGQSGGATLTAGLLALRNDLTCAVMGSGRLSAIRNHPEPSDPALAYFDPSEGFPAYGDRDTRVFVVTDPEDRIIPPGSQKGFITRARQLGWPATQLLVTATDRNRHAVSAYATVVAVSCIRGNSDDVVSQTLAVYMSRRIAALGAAAREQAGSDESLPDPAASR